MPQPLIINPSDKNYQVLSNYQGSTQQIPSIQIVNVQEAPKEISADSKNTAEKSTTTKNTGNSWALAPSSKVVRVLMENPPLASCPEWQREHLFFNSGWISSWKSTANEVNATIIQAMAIPMRIRRGYLGGARLSGFFPQRRKRRYGDYRPSAG